MPTTTKSLGLSRLNEALAFWETLDNSQFYFGSFDGRPDDPECGSVHCLLGWIPQVSEDWPRYFTAEEEFFEITSEEANHLFYPSNPLLPGSVLERDCTLAEALANVRSFIAEKEGVTA